MSPLLRALLIACVAAALAPRARAAGVTAHVVAGEMVIDEVSDSALRDLLNRNRDIFLSGTAVPDKLLIVTQGAQAFDDTFDSGSHGTTQEFCEPPKGYEAALWTSYQQCTAKNASDPACERTLALLFGILTHEVTDGPWHNDFIDARSATMCDPCQSGLQSAGYKSYEWCNPGGKSVNRDAATGYVTSGQDGRHKVADGDIDVCLARHLKKVSGDPVDLRNPLIGAPATYQGKAKASNIADLTTASRQRSVGCNGGEFPDAKFSGCYTCPHGYSHNSTLTVGTKGVCFKKTGSMPWDYSLKTADKQHGYGGCDSGEFEDALATGCYSCPSGYSHDRTLTVGTKGVCFKVKVSGGSAVASAGLCPDGQVLDPRNGGECWTCPSGFTRDLVIGVTDPAACAHVGTVACSKLSVPATITNGTLPALSSESRAQLLSSLKTAGFSTTVFNELSVDTAGLAFQQMQSAEADGAIGPAMFTNAAAACPGMIEHGLDGKGALQDSAAESARFLSELWKVRGRAGVNVISFEDYEKAIVADGQVLDRSHHRTCGDQECGNWATCQAGQCQFEFTRGSKCSVPDQWSSTVQNAGALEGSSATQARATTAAAGNPLAATFVATAKANAQAVAAAAAAAKPFLSAPEDGSMLDLYTHDDGSGRQKWTFQKSSDGTSYNIVIGGGTRDGRRYLSTTSTGNKVDLYVKDDESGRQRWIIKPSGEAGTASNCIYTPCSLSVNIVVKGGVSGSNTMLGIDKGGNVILSDGDAAATRWVVR